MAQQPIRRAAWSRVLRRTFACLLCGYLGIVAMFAALQRALIYVPTRGAVAAEEAGVHAAQLQELTGNTSDGVKLHGWLISAESGDDVRSAVSDSGRPLILFFPGNGGHRGYRSAEIAQFVELGCDVLYFDYRGYAENRGTPSEAAFAADARTIWDLAVKELQVPPARIVIYGESLGGGVAARLAAELCAEKIQPRGLILRATFTSLPNAAAYHYPWLPARWLLLDRYETLGRIGNIDCPLMILHGRADEIVPFSHGEMLFDAARSVSHNNVPKTFIELPAAGHNDIMLVAPEEVRKAVSAFLARL